MSLITPLPPSLPASLLPFLNRQWNNLHVQVEDQDSNTPLGYGWHNTTFPVRALSSRSAGVNITITAAFSDLAPLIKEQCAARNYVTLASYGKPSLPPSLPPSFLHFWKKDRSFRFPFSYVSYLLVLTHLFIYFTY